MALHRRTAVLITAATLLGMSQTAWAGGLYLNSFATPSMSASGAGREAMGEDASTAFTFHNPAGMTRLSGNHLMVGAGLIAGKVKFDPDNDTRFPGPDGGNQAGVAPLLGTYYAHSLSDRWSVGASLFSMSGAALDPDNDWAGQFQLEKISLLTLAFNSSVAFKVNDWLSIAAGGTLMYATLGELKVAVPPPLIDGRVKVKNADDWAGGWNLGLLLEPRDGTRIGLIYQSKIETHLKGDIDFNRIGTQAGIDLDLPFVQFARLGFLQKLDERFSLLGTVGWEDWSRFDRIPVSVARGSRTVKTGWHDTFHFSLGLRYQLNPDWRLQTGVSYDTSPVDSGDRNAALPIDHQIRWAFGAEHRVNDNVTVGGAFEYMNGGKGKIDSRLLKGDYKDNHLFFLAFHVNWRLSDGS